MNFSVVKHDSRHSWLQWRLSGIGSSDAPVVMGVSRFRNREDLLAEKVKSVAVEDTTNDYIKERGNKIEELVRTYYSSLIGQDLVPVSCTSNDRVWQLASLDGAHLDSKTMIEIKLLTSYDPRKGKPRNTKAPGYVKFLEAKGGKVPDEYFPQLQHQMAVMGFDECVFIGYDEQKGSSDVNTSNTAIVHVKRDGGYIKELTEKEDEFWRLVEEARGI